MRLPFIKPSIFQEAAKLGGTEAAGAFGLEHILGRIFHANPEIAMHTSIIPKARELAENFFRRDFAQAKNFKNVASKQGIELDFDIGREVLLGGLREKSNLIYQKYRQRLVKQGGIDIPSKNLIERLSKEIEDAGGNVGNLRNRNYITEQMFDEEIGRTIRRFGEGTPNPHPIPEINEIARAYKEELYKPLFERQIKNGMLRKGIAEDKEFVESYVSQIFDRDSINRNPGEFLRIVTKAFDRYKQTIVARGEEKLSKFKEKAKTAKSKSAKARKAKQIKKYTKELENRRTFDSRKAAQDFVFDIQMNGRHGMTSRDLFGELSRFQKTRRLIIPKDMLAQFEPFLENDINRLSYLYTRSILPRILLKERFGEVSLNKAAREIMDQANQLSQSPNITQRQRFKIIKEGTRMVDYLYAERDRFLGTYKLPDNPDGIFHRVSDAILKLNLLRSLGGVTPSSIPDIARLIARFGFVRTGKLLSSVINNKEFADIAKQDLKKSLGIYELLLQDRFFLQTEISKGITTHTKFEKALDKLSGSFGKITLIAPWNQTMKQFAALDGASFLMETAEAFAKTGKVEKNLMARFLEGGLDQKDLTAIFDEFRRYGREHQGIYLLQTGEWKNRQLAEKVNRFLKREVDIAITTPGIASQPLWRSTTFGKHAGQFRSFAFAATNGILLSGLQYRDAMAINGLLLTMFMGTGVYALKQKLAGKEIDYSPNNLLAEGIDRSGVLGWISDASNVIDRASRGKIGINPLLGAPGASRYKPFDIWAMLGGPTAGTLSDITRIIGSTSEMEFNPGDITAMRRMVPYQNLWYFRFMLDAVEHGMQRQVEGQ